MNRSLWIGGWLLIASLVGTSMAAAKEEPPVLRVKEMHDPVYPFSLTLRGVNSGKAEAVVSIDPDGRVSDKLVVSYTQPEFNRSVMECLKDCVFYPIKVHGEALAVRAKLTFIFDSHGVVVSMTAADQVAAWVERIRGEHTLNLLGKIDELDRAPLVTRTVQPRYPAELAKQKVSGRATIDFYVDENGKVHMPTLVSSDQDEFAEASADALMEWQFAPITRRGEPVIVQMRQEFVFNPKS